MASKKESEVETLEQIRRLLILALSTQGVQGDRIAEVIGVSPATVSRILSPNKKRKK